MVRAETMTEEVSYVVAKYDYVAQEAQVRRNLVKSETLVNPGNVM